MLIPEFMVRYTMLFVRTLRLLIDLFSGLIAVLLVMFHSPYQEQYLEHKYEAFNDNTIMLGILSSVLLLLLRGVHAVLTRRVLQERYTYADRFFAGFFCLALGYWLYFSCSTAAVHMS